MKTLPDASVDAIVTDPPYELGFMGKGWDKTGVANDVAVWAECLRVLKPGGYLLAFSGTRTYHRMVCAVEDAGFEIRDQLAWVYGSGFPKSHNGPWGGTALKPAWEPIVMARKPLIGTVEENWMVHGTGALNVEGCRVETDENLNGGAYAKVRQESTSEWATLHKTTGAEFVQPAGRWPANLAHDGSDEVLAAFPQAPGQMAAISGTAPSEKTSNVYGRMAREGEASAESANDGVVGFKMRPGMRRLDAGSAARFFYCAKASRADRNAGLDSTTVHQRQGARPASPDETGKFPDHDHRERVGNFHPTVKPTELMRWLCRLVTPAGGVVLDPFTGSGSTGKAAMLEGFPFIGCELNPDYIKLAEARIAAAEAEVLW
jgi:site-specific DNA-methyltransferase (adenine-specific)